MGNIEKTLKKFVYTSIGFVSLSAEKFKNTINELVKDNKLSEKEGKKIINDFFKEANSKKGKYKNDLKKTIKKAAKKMDFAKNSELDELSKRLHDLEKAMAEKLK